MELLLDNKKSEYMRRVATGSAIHEENTEIIVSDRSPDIMRIVRGAGNVFLRDKEARDGKLSVEGNIKGVVLYIADGEQNVRKLDVAMPFFHTFDAEDVTSDSKVIVKTCLRTFDMREINPRKVSVRASVEISYRAYEASEQVICGGVIDGEKYGVCTRKCKVYSYRPIIIRDKSFSISDDIEFSGDETDMSSILLGEVSLLPTETKIIGNKSILKGIADVSYVYAAEDGSIHSDERELPFSQILDIEGMEDSHELEVELAVTGLDFDPQYDASGSARYMTVSITAEANAIVYEQTEADAVEDAYSTMYDFNIEKRNLPVAKYIEKFEKRVPVSETVETGSGVKRVLDVSASLFPPVKRRENESEVISSDAVISVMYIGEDDLVYNASRRIPVVCPIELSKDHSYEASSRIRGRGYSLGHDNEINVRFFADFDIVETEVGSASVVSAMSVDAEKSGDGRRTSSITIKRMPRECDVWSVAKEHSTTVGEIAVANGIPEEGCIPRGRMLLIPKHR